MAAHPRITRLAPSPTGALHLGNARTFLINHALARQWNARVVCRIEDLDTPRVKPGADRQALDDLRWLGLTWDGPVVRQLTDLAPYESALASLRDRGLAYPCYCTRKEIEAARSAPHGDEHELRYPGTCRDRPAAKVDDAPAWRVKVPDETIGFDDGIAGPQAFNVQRHVGDFVIATKAGMPAYQLAVVIDDARQAVTDVVRGDDLLASTARQMLLGRMLALAPPPRYWHLPLVLGADGRRLAKRHGDTRLAWYRERGVAAERVIGLIAFWSGVTTGRSPMTTQQFVETFDLQRLPRSPVTFTPDDHAWLCSR